MQRTMAALAAVFVITGVGCTNSKPKDLPGTDGGKTEVSLARLSLKSICPGTADEECRGAYGFNILEDGTFEIGPSPSGQKLTGKLRPSQLDRVKPFFGAGSSLALNTQAQCEERDGAYAYHTITLHKPGSETTLIRASVTASETTDYCYLTENSAVAADLHDSVRDMLEQYYPDAFPSACVDAVEQFHSISATLNSCVSDQDCSYVDDNSYEPIPAASSQWVATDACEFIRPVVVGNTASLFGAQDKLKAAYNNASQVCGMALRRNDCVDGDGFLSSKGAPACVQGVCRVNSAIPY